MIFDFNVIPFISVGPFIFGEKIFEFTELYAFLKLEKGNKNELDCYLFTGEAGGFEVACDENDLIAVVTLKDKCIYEGFDLILMDINSFLLKIKTSKLDCKIEEIDMDNRSMSIYYLENSGLQLWVNQIDEIEIVDVFG